MTKPDKPPYGSPKCNGCGQCCLEKLCVLGMRVFKQVDGPCPALIDAGDRYGCGLVLHPERFAPVRAALNGRVRLTEAAMLLIGTGIGCDAQMPGEPDADDAYRKRRVMPVSDRDVVRAFEAWGTKI